MERNLNMFDNKRNTQPDPDIGFHDSLNYPNMRIEEVEDYTDVPRINFGKAGA